MSIINTQFDDVYSVAYRVIDSAAVSRDIIKLYKGSHIREQPHGVVFEFLAHFANTQGGFVSFVNKNHGKIYSAVDVNNVIKRVYEIESRTGETYPDFRDYILQRKHKLGHYRGARSGYAAESRAAVCEYFDKLGLKFNVHDVTIFSGGIKGAFMCFCAALFSSRSYDDINILGGSFLMPIGYYQSLRNIPSLFKCQINTLDIYNEDSIKAWIASTRNIKRRAIYVPTVNNADGLVLSAESMRCIMEHVVEENLQGRELFVFWDDVYRGSRASKGGWQYPFEFTVHTNGKTYSATDYSIVATSPSKTYALPTSRVCFAATTNRNLCQAMNHYQTLMSFGRVSQIDELCALVAMLCTPDEWVAGNNRIYEANLTYLKQAVANINRKYSDGEPLVTLGQPEGGWYFMMQISKDCTGQKLRYSIEFLSVLLNYSSARNSGIACLPGELFGYLAEDKYIYRCTLAVSKPTLDEFIRRLDEVIRILTSPERDDVVDSCTRTLNKIVNIEELMEHTRY